ncbi:MAG: hypothetical protein [Olavius algarvensis Gamma 1 endosymbiont]|nr:MAG: hypothetical protein [Olavius algarvensis Gamma 1 endosymbiont]
MYDYKLCPIDPSSSKSKHTWYKRLPLAVGLAAGVLYGIVHLGLTWQGGWDAPKTHSNIIPLTLPPYTGPGESTRRGIGPDSGLR